MAEHNAGKYRGHTWNRRPVKLVYHETFANITDAIAAERQLKGWSRAKKEALMNGDMPALQTGPRSARQGFPEHPSRRTLLRAPQDEVRGERIIKTPHPEETVKRSSPGIGENEERA